MDIRPSPIAGHWYPGTARELKRVVTAYLESARPEGLPQSILGLIAPHAGLKYSGPVAACAFKAVQGLEFQTVAVLCPSHFHDDAAVLTSAHDGYATPLGVVPVDRAGLRRLRAALPQLDWAELREDTEHAIEIELPFLQCVLTPGFTLLPLMLRDQTEAIVRALGDALAELLAGVRALLIGSSDLSHYYPYTTARRLDAEMLRQIEALSVEGVLQAQASGRGQACGSGAIATTLRAVRALGASCARVVGYATSGDTSGEYASVVGYGAVVLGR